MKKKRILMIGAGREMCDSALARNLDYLLVETPKRLKPDLLKIAPEVLILDYEDRDLLRKRIAALHAESPFESVISLTEPGLLPAADIEDFLGLNSKNRSLVELTKDKYLMRQRLAEAGIDDLANNIVSSKSEILNFLKTAETPIIVKPADGQASLGVNKIATHQELEDMDLDQLGQYIIVEPFLTGPEYSVEAFSFNGKHVVLSITQKLLATENGANPFVEAGHVMPAKIDIKDQDCICAYVSDCLDALGLQDGPSHTEIKLTSDGPRIIETHNRVGGDQILDLLLLSHEINILDLTLAWPLGLIEPLASRPQAKRAAAIQFIMPEPGTISHISGLHAARRLNNVVDLILDLKIGDEIKPVLESYDRAGHVICVGDTPDEALACCQLAIETIHIETIK